MVRPSVSRMEDKVSRGHVSFWRTKSMTPRDVPDTIFTREHLQKRN
jgi:hypothetical protein